jgi:hypothetical protein
VDEKVNFIDCAVAEDRLQLFVCQCNGTRFFGNLAEIELQPREIRLVRQLGICAECGSKGSCLLR